MKICVIGAGYVGLVAALSFATFKNNVICVEKDQEKVDKLKQGVPIIYEKGLEPLLKTCLSKKKIIFTTDIDRAVKKSDIIFIAVGTPTKEDWSVDVSQVMEVANQISQSINTYKIIVTKSTVPVGTQKRIKDIIHDNGVQENKYDVVSNPEFLREGRAINDFLHGERIVLGCDSEKASSIMKKLYKPLRTPVIVTTPPTAELIKYASNAFLATKISFINELANLSNIVEADIDTIAYALGMDKRISPEFLQAGIGYGGSCFPKDTKALVNIGKHYDYDFRIVKSAIDVNETQRLLPIDILLNHYESLEGKIITLLGLTFKPGTDDIREAPSLYIIKALLEKGAIVKCYDPMVSNEIKKIYPQLTYCDDLYDSVVDSECLILCTELDDIYQMDLKKVVKKMMNAIMIDGRNMFDMDEVKSKGFKGYYSMGKGSYT
ncbi:UDP-glucose/GDP-mannose dehydrogenase family protein [Vallitalea pronyensis]|uniref:UDP-glucose 6-dehydrogenase n=1 Tax=Vallitalea pronyensis TaxID=1348613 RepID=A0A8J8MMI5_9FIRM|nr:UDP-glucose/GDP-mannose dehydrogenase family protein [Vallitalea pronyensis]QUI24234.1 UDP-glucose/GDP-mannose dehydrogenase family protein [Vallitalea pronyensis]